MKTATLIKDVSENFQGHAELFKLSQKIEYTTDFDKTATTEFVVISAAVAPFSGPETYVFPADKDGNILDWAELDGSYRGGLNIETALSQAGFVKA